MLTQCPDVCVPVVVTNSVVLPDTVPTAGAAPAPPPMTGKFAVSAALDAHVAAPEKYGMPPDVPATVKAGVVVAVPTETSPPVQPTLVTVPPLIVLQPNPVLVVQINALLAVLQLGIAIADSGAVLPVGFPITVLAACDLI